MIADASGAIGTRLGRAAARRGHGARLRHGRSPTVGDAVRIPYRDIPGFPAADGAGPRRRAGGRHVRGADGDRAERPLPHVRGPPAEVTRCRCGSLPSSASHPDAHQCGGRASGGTSPRDGHADLRSPESHRPEPAGRRRRCRARSGSPTCPIRTMPSSAPSRATWRASDGWHSPKASTRAPGPELRDAGRGPHARAARRRRRRHVDGLEVIAARARGHALPGSQQSPTWPPA